VSAPKRADDTIEPSPAGPGSVSIVPSLCTGLAFA
jgi:hypothetical protein